VSEHRPRPPRWAAALLARVLPPGTTGASVRADLEQELAEMAAREGPAKARRWYAKEAVKLSLHFLWRGAGAAERDHSKATKGGGMDQWANHARLALRQLRRAPGFMATAIATIALGIGINVAIFSVVSTVLLEPLPYENPDELVAIWEWHVPRDRMGNVANPGNFAAWRDGSEAFAEMTAISLLQPATVTAAGEPEESTVQYAAPGFFSVLGLEAALGRTFTTDLSAVETTEVVLSDRYWRERFGADPEVVGRGLQINGEPVVVVGVLPSEYVVFGEGTDLWASIQIDLGDQTTSGRWLMVVGRLAPGATLPVADAELKSIAAALRDEFPEFNAGWSVNLVSLQEEIVGDVSTMLWVLLGAVGLLLLIACANVANLYLVRATGRQREMAVRRSLGASGGTLAGQLLTESLLVAVVGAVIGVAGAAAATGWMAAHMPDAFALPRIEGVTLDGRVLVFAGAVTVGTALLFGLFPALKASRTSPAETLAAEGRAPSGRTGMARDLLVVVEVGLSVVLLAGAALFVRSFTTLAGVDDGIEAEQVLVGRINLSGSSYEDDEGKVAFFEELIGRLAAAPEVSAAGGITFLPMDGLGAATSYWPEDRPAPPADERRAADVRNVAGAYFEAMGIELLQGRIFDRRDRADGPQTVVVNRSLAQLYWPDEPAVGKRLVINWVDDTPWEIVGVVEDVRLDGPGEAARETVYVHYPRAAFFPWLNLTVRAVGDPARLSSLVRSELSALDPSIAIGRVRIMGDIVDLSVARPRMTSVLMALFAACATLLSAVGLYGVLAYTVTQRVREIGVRVALGAEPRRVVRLVVGQGARLVGLGLLLGVAGALTGSRFVEALLYQVAPSDPVALSAAIGVSAVVALLACTIPAWRASRVAPADALRPE
jgi:putative ABC transport system permease protein